MRILPHNAVTVPQHAKRVFSGEIFDVYQWPQQLFDGTTATFEMLKRPDTVEFIVVHDDRLLLVREEQPGGTPVLRFPGGRVDPGETWRHAAERECAEELGMRLRKWRLVLVKQPIRKIEWFVATFIATDLAETFQPKHDAGERIELVPMAFSEVKQLVMNGDDQTISHVKPLFARTDSLDDLLELPEFTGEEVR